MLFNQRHLREGHLVHTPEQQAVLRPKPEVDNTPFGEICTVLPLTGRKAQPETPLGTVQLVIVVAPLPLQAAAAAKKPKRKRIPKTQDKRIFCRNLPPDSLTDNRPFSVIFNGFVLVHFDRSELSTGG